MDRRGIGQIQRFKVTAVVLSDPAIPKINGQHAVGTIACDGCDVSDVNIADILAVFRLHDFVA